jgi:hypothetical protein
MHRLKNGHRAHVLTTEDRRKGAEVANRRRRIIREAFEDEKFERQIQALFARDEARRHKRRERYQRQKRAQPQRAEPEPYTADLDGYPAARAEPSKHRT